MKQSSNFPVLTAEEAVSFIKNGDSIALSGFSPAGAAKAVPMALIERARREQSGGQTFRVRILTGASSGGIIDDEMAKAGAISWRAPYQSGATLRRQINSQEVEYVDMHLSHVPQMVEYGFFGPIDFAVVEATEITPDGRVYLTTSIGASPTFLKNAERVIIEINHRQAARLREMTDIFVLPPPPHRSPIPIHDPLTRIGWPYAVVNPKKVIGIVESDLPDQSSDFSAPDGVGRQIASHVVRFLMDEMKAGRIPESFLPLQAGVGNVANSVLSELGAHPDIPKFSMYSEVFQDAMADLMEKQKLLSASATSLTLSSPRLCRIVENMDFFAPRIVLRPQEISNHPGIIRRLGVIALNTILEADIYGNVNSSHLYGMDVVNGVGGSGEFTRNSYLSILMTPSTAKKNAVSAVVPMCPHVDSNEHSVQVIVTEQGLADLRGLGPLQRAERMIENCAHPIYRDYLRRYIRDSRSGHIPHDLEKCFELHRNLLRFGTMLPE
ncbi:MAG: succinate CoA transferase [Desulfobacteraceae bacterium]|nr:MAG: succinate CoA transferase [Desulfobacteraceae bacterium]